MSILDSNSASGRLNEAIREMAAEVSAEVVNDIKAVMAIPSARRLLMHILHKECVFGPLGEGATTEHAALIQVGRHNMAQDILRMVNEADPDSVALALREYNQSQRDYKARIDKLMEEAKTND